MGAQDGGAGVPGSPRGRAEPSPPATQDGCAV